MYIVEPVIGHCPRPVADNEMFATVSDDTFVNIWKCNVDFQN